MNNMNVFLNNFALADLLRIICGPVMQRYIIQSICVLSVMDIILFPPP